MPLIFLVIMCSVVCAMVLREDISWKAGFCLCERKKTNGVFLLLAAQQINGRLKNGLSHFLAIALLMLGDKGETIVIGHTHFFTFPSHHHHPLFVSLPSL